MFLNGMAGYAFKETKKETENYNFKDQLAAPHSVHVILLSGLGRHSGF